MNLVDLAEKVARKAHEGQFRRDGVTPYITHSEAVAKSLEGESEQVIATAWLHDVLEDTEVTDLELAKIGFPAHVIACVSELSRSGGISYKAFIRHIALCCEDTRKVKIADILHNLSDSPTEKQKAKYAKALRFLGYTYPSP